MAPVAVEGAGGAAGSLVVRLEGVLVAEQDVEDLADLRRPGLRGAHRLLVVHLVGVSPTHALAREEARFHEFCDDPLSGALSDVERRRDVPQSNCGLPRDHQQYPRVVGNEGPLPDV